MYHYEVSERASAGEREKKRTRVQTIKIKIACSRFAHDQSLVSHFIMR